MSVLALDIGGTKVKLGIVSRSGRILESTQFEIGHKAKAENIISRSKQVLKNSKVKNISGIGIACAGFIDASSKKILFSPNLNWKNVPLASIAEKAFKKPARVENDVNAVALGEYRFGAGIGVRNLVAVFVGTGIGGGIVTDGHLVRGANGRSAEIGHMIFKAKGNLCGCGRRGCFEAYAGGRFIMRNYRRLGGDKLLKTPSEIFYAAKRGNHAAARVRQEAVEALTLLCVNLATSLDTEVIVLGGGVIEHSPGIEKEIAARVERYYSGNWKACPKVVLSELGSDAALLGAAFSIISYPKKCGQA
ncbi:MAG: ROK family protein [Planctomycetota bacterium]